MSENNGNKKKTLIILVISDNLYNYYELFKDVKIGEYNIQIEQAFWDKSIY